MLVCLSLSLFTIPTSSISLTLHFSLSLIFSLARLCGGTWQIAEAQFRCPISAISIGQRNVKTYKDVYVLYTYIHTGKLNTCVYGHWWILYSIQFCIWIIEYIVIACTMYTNTRTHYEHTVSCLTSDPSNYAIANRGGVSMLLLLFYDMHPFMRAQFSLFFLLHFLQLYDNVVGCICESNITQKSSRMQFYAVPEGHGNWLACTG